MESTRYLSVQSVVQAELIGRNVVKVSGVILPEVEMLLQFEVVAVEVDEA